MTGTRTGSPCQALIPKKTLATKKIGSIITSTKLDDQPSTGIALVSSSKPQKAAKPTLKPRACSAWRLM